MINHQGKEPDASGNALAPKPQTQYFYPGGDIGGPMNLGQEYRWNVPVLTYAFDASFFDYFGSNGVAAVESAINIFNSLPGVWELSVSNYPLAATSLNYQAQAQGLLDLKSQTLASLLEQLGAQRAGRDAAPRAEIPRPSGKARGVVGRDHGAGRPCQPANLCGVVRA